MCELFALNSRQPAAATFSLSGFAARGGRTADHVDGWGVAFHDGERCEVTVEDSPAAESELARHLGHHPVRARNILAHIRKATQGARTLENCHPFRREWAGRTWVFAHNGDLKDFHPELDGSFTPAGQTDSERAFCWLMQRLQQHFGDQAPAWPELAATLTPWIHEVAEHGRFNLLLTDGRSMLAHASTKLHWLQRRPPFGHVSLRDGDLSVDLATVNNPADRMARTGRHSLPARCACSRTVSACSSAKAWPHSLRPDQAGASAASTTLRASCSSSCRCPSSRKLSA